MKHLLLILLIGCAPNPNEDNSAILIVLAGQSNIAGSWQENLGNLPSNNVTEIHRLSDWSFSKEAYYKNPNYGPSTNIARVLEYKYPGKKIKILNIAAGGSTMSDWRQDPIGGLYTPSIALIKKAINEGYKLTEFYWYQGESDAAVLPPPSYQQPYIWASLFDKLLNNLKTDIGNNSFNIVFAQIATTTAHNQLPNWDIVKQQQALASQYLAIPMVITEDLKLCDDVHIDQSEYDKLAIRFVSF